MKKILSKGISLLLTVAMVLSLVSTSAFAADFSKLQVTGGEILGLLPSVGPVPEIMKFTESKEHGL